MAERKHWSDLPVDHTHVWDAEGYCQGCMMHMSWPGARDRCTLRVKRPPKKPRSLEDTDHERSTAGESGT